MQYPIRRLLAIQLLVLLRVSAASWMEEATRGSLDYDRGLYHQAIADFERALPLADSPLNRAVTLHRLAVAYGKLAQFTAAEQCYQGAIAIFRTEGDSPKLATSLSGLGEIYRAERRLDDALATEQASFRMLKRLGMTRAQEAANVYSVTGEILFFQRRFKAAERSMRLGLKILVDTIGPNHPDVATSLNNLGVVALARKHASEGEALLIRALNIRKASLGPEHPLIASTLLSLSSVYLAQQEYAEARETCVHSVAMMQHFFPPSHPDLIKGQIVLAVIARAVEDSSAAARILEAAIEAIGAQDIAITGEYLQLLNLSAKFLGEAGETEKAHQYSLEARRLLEESGWKSPTRSVVSFGELEASGAR